MVAGFSPSQWVLGYQPSLAGDLLSDAVHPSHFGGNTSFEDMLNKRHSAKKALLDADADRRLRRALQMKYKGTNSEYSLGQRVWFWRDARWLSPAHVVMKEYHQDTDTPQVSVYWLAFKTQLIRCAPHHIRADVKGMDHALDDTQLALNTVRQLRSRGVTRYYDLHRLNRQNLADVRISQSIVPGGACGAFPPSTASGSMQGKLVQDGVTAGAPSLHSSICHPQTLPELHHKDGCLHAGSPRRGRS